MISRDIQALVTRELESWQPPTITPGSTLGRPWTAERYGPALQRLRTALVVPFQQTFRLQELDDPAPERHSGEAVYWVVAVTDDMLLWYDASSGEFGVGEPGVEHGLPTSIGLRGDLVGAFCSW